MILVRWGPAGIESWRCVVAALRHLTPLTHIVEPASNTAIGGTIVRRVAADRPATIFAGHAAVQSTLENNTTRRPCVFLLTVFRCLFRNPLLGQSEFLRIDLGVMELAIQPKEFITDPLRLLLELLDLGFHLFDRHHIKSSSSVTISRLRGDMDTTVSQPATGPRNSNLRSGLGSARISRTTSTAFTCLGSQVVANLGSVSPWTRNLGSSTGIP